MQQPNIEMDSQTIQSHRKLVLKNPFPFASTEISLSTQLGRYPDYQAIPKATFSHRTSAASRPSMS
jgi:hypothetical protein